jgi:hypothetical protein
MCKRRPSILAAAWLLAFCAGARAEVVLTTDKEAYVVGEIVHVEARNTGPDDKILVSTPWMIIWNEDTMECVTGCVGLPDITPFPAGTTITAQWDTGLFPDDPGPYAVHIATDGGPTVHYLLSAAVPAEPDGWSALKARFR